MTGILKRLATTANHRMAVDEYEMEAKQVEALTDQVGRAWEAMALLIPHQARADKGLHLASPRDRIEYQQSLESVCKLTEDFMSLDVGYSIESTAGTPSLLGRIWKFIVGACKAIADTVKRMLGIREKKFIGLLDSLEEIIVACDRAVGKAARPATKRDPVMVQDILEVSGTFGGAGEVNNRASKINAAANEIFKQLERLINANAESFTPKETKSETAAAISKSMNLKEDFELSKNASITIIGFRSKSEHPGFHIDGYNGDVLSIADIKASCKAGIELLRARSANKDDIAKKVQAYSSKIEAIAKKNYSALADLDRDAFRRAQGMEKDHDNDWRKKEQAANVYNALTSMINTHAGAEFEIGRYVGNYVSGLLHFMNSNIMRYKQHA